MSDSSSGYFIPEPSPWPIVGSVAVTGMLMGFAHTLHGGGSMIMYAGIALLIYMLFGWFGDVIAESQSNSYNSDVDMSFRWSMGWFIFSEVMFFAAFFGTLFYARTLSIPWLDGASNNVWTAKLLWPNFEAAWPLLSVPDAAGAAGKIAIVEAKEAMGAWGLPAINTVILLTSGVTITFAHWGLKEDNRKKLVMGLFATVALGFVFVVLQAVEYMHAYEELSLQLNSGMYGSTFYLLTGFHGLHVTIGALMLTVVLFRAMKGHFTEENHFAFEAAAWYWHFVDVVWLVLFVFVYWI